MEFEISPWISRRISIASMGGVDPPLSRRINTIFHSGISNSMVGNDIPQWEIEFHGGKWWDVLLAYPASTPIHEGGVLPPPPQRGAASGRPLLCGYPCGWVSRLGRQGGDLTISHRGISFPTMEYHLPPWNSKSTVEYHTPPWHDHILMTTWKPLQTYIHIYR